MFDAFFNPKSVAVIGASEDSRKLGHVALKSLIEGGFQGAIYPVNPHSTMILGRRAFRSVLEVPGSLDLAVVIVPKANVLGVVEECGKKRVPAVVVISSGFSEVGDDKSEQDLRNVARAYRLRLIGPNCLGILVPKTKLDTIFLPRSRFKRPPDGGIAFISQSGAVASCTLDLMAKDGTGISKFVGYGNGADVREKDLLEALAQDKDTRVICMYLEGLKDGRTFLETAKRLTKEKPIVVLKGGTSQFGAAAVASHTAALAGSGDVFRGACKQAHIAYAETLEEMYDYAKIFDKSMKPRGRHVQIVTNGGGYGIMCADALQKHSMHLAELSQATTKQLQRVLPEIAIVRNPMDLTGGATTEEFADVLGACVADKHIDIVIAITLLQTPLVTPDIVDVLVKLHRLRKKPLVVVSSGGNFTEIHRVALESAGVPTYTFPENAVRALKALCDYHRC